MTQNLFLKRKSNNLAVYENDKLKLTYPLSFFDAVFCYGDIELKSSLIRYLSENGKYIALFSDTGKFKSIITNQYGQNLVNNRIKQYSIFMDKEKNLMFCKSLIIEKLKEIERCFNIDLRYYINKLKIVDNKDSILGIEGIASNMMFTKLKEMFSSINLEFPGRIYNPPTDKINSVLSASYNYFYYIITALLYIKGFDAFLGMMHVKKGMHFAFSSDLIEIIRPSITLSVYYFILNNGIDKLSFLERESVFLDRASMLTLIKYLSKDMDNYIDKIISYLSDIFDSLYVIIE